MENIKITPILIVYIAIIAAAGIFLVFISGNGKKLDKIKAKKVGDGQHGDDRFMSDKEAKNFYTIIDMPEEISDRSDEYPSGRVINYDEKTRELYVDTSDTHARITAPTESGKTTEYVIPNVQYNIMAGTTMIIPDLKKEIYRNTAQDAVNCGYNVYCIDFQNPEFSDLFDFFEDINAEMEHYMKHEDLKSKAECEDAAGALALDIVKARARGSNENIFFENASKGVIHSLTLLLSMFAKSEQKHIGSISNILQGMLQIPKDKADKTPAILKLMRKLPEGFGARKYLGAAFAAAEETEANIYASVLGDLEPFINSIAEQILAKPANKKMFRCKDLLDNKSILYIVIPEVKEQFKVYATAIIRKLYNQLTTYANEMPDKKLPKRIFIEWEEFALYPKVDNIQEWLAIMRGRGIIGDFIYQSDYQLKEKYGEDIMNIMRDQCAVSIYLALAQEDTETSERLSKALGTMTIKTGSVSVSHDAGKTGSIFGGTSHSETEQMMERALMSPSEVLHMDTFGIKLLLRRNSYPFKTHLTRYYDEKWGLVPAKQQEQVLCNDMEHISYMSFNELMNAIDDYNLGDVHNAGCSTCTIETEHVEIKESPFTKEMHRISRELLERTHDPHCVELLEKQEYRLLMDYMKQYRKVISMYDLQKLLEPLAE